MIRCTFEDGGHAALRHATVNAVLLHQGKILLVRRAMNLHEGGKLAVPGGFCERDETVKEAVLREVREETGYDSQVQFLLRITDAPIWKGDDRQNIDFVFVVETKEKIADPDKEVTEVILIDLSQLPSPEVMAFDHLEHLHMYQRYIANPDQLQLPVLG